MSTSRMKLVFLGAGEFGIPTLEALVARHEVAMVVSQPDRPAGRGGKLTPTPISAWVQTHAPTIPLLRPEDINEASVAAQVRAVGADAWVVIAFGQKLGKELLDGVFAVNLHGSILPRWRGAAPINWAVVCGDARVGNSAITLAERMDAGLVLGTTSRELDPNWTAGELHDMLSADGPELILKVLEEKRTGTLAGTVQDESLVTKAKKLSRADGWVDFSKDATECRRWVHGMTPWPGVWVQIDALRVKVLRCAASGGRHAAEVGTLLDEHGSVACGGGTVLQLLEVQPEGKKPMTWAAFGNGYRPRVGGKVLSGAKEQP